MYRKDSSCSTECFGAAGVGAFFLKEGVLEPEGVRLLPELGMRLDGVANWWHLEGVWCEESVGRKDGLVFLIDETALTGEGGVDGRSLEKGFRAVMISSVFSTFIILQVICAACVCPHFRAMPSFRFSSVIASLTACGTSEKYRHRAKATPLETSSRCFSSGNLCTAE